MWDRLNTVTHRYKIVICFESNDNSQISTLSASRSDKAKKLSHPGTEKKSRVRVVVVGMRRWLFMSMIFIFLRRPHFA